MEDPANGDTLTKVSKGDEADINAAVKSARAAFETGPWSRMSASDRSRLIYKLGDLLEKHSDEFAQLESLDNGKPLTVAAAADVPLSTDMFHYMAGWATKITGDTFPISVPYTPDARYLSDTMKEPVGVVGQIIPWNFPLLMAAWKLAPALAADCTIVLKPAEQTPLSTISLGELIQEAGFPKGVVNIISGYGETGSALARHPDVDKMAFTGSTRRPWSVAVNPPTSSLMTPTFRAPSPVWRVLSSLTMTSAVAPAPGSIFTMGSTTAWWNG